VAAYDPAGHGVHDETPAETEYDHSLVLLDSLADEQLPAIYIISRLSLSCPYYLNSHKPRKPNKSITKHAGQLHHGLRVKG
jgi:hypothetical protein